MKNLIKFNKVGFNDLKKEYENLFLGSIGYKGVDELEYKNKLFYFLSELNKEQMIRIKIFGSLLHKKYCNRKAI